MAVDKDFLKSCLLGKKSRVYTMIVDQYYDQVEAMKPTRFSEWLAKELGVSQNDISVQSIHSAVVRRKKKSLDQPVKKKVDSSSDDGNFNTEIPKTFPGFK
ncbi:MAG: hypothetical protein IT213_16985 [Cytophagales bacterium]|nr:hypothetical protein [Cytophagales bacterium]